jgi:hypothetical protein
MTLLVAAGAARPPRPHARVQNSSLDGDVSSSPSLPPTTQRENYSSILLLRRLSSSTYAAGGRGLMLAASRGIRWRAVPCEYRRGRRWHTAWRRGVFFGLAPVVTLRYCSSHHLCVLIK